ncbi:hypothetical protein GALL_461880 [mine drainage metagenome]|uniref:Uncharacterized protein n=1 Tax=mine drainage metagenome TaxID=410659 RepID=A0A1J5PN08_9ZZZZ
MLPYIIEIAGRAYVLGNLEIPFADDFWGEAASDFEPESEVRAYCEAARTYIRPRLASVHGILPPIDEGMPARFVVGVAIPLDGLADRSATRMALTQAFGVVADLPDLPFADTPSTEDVPAEPQAAAAVHAVETIDLTPSWGEWGNLYRRFAESGEAKAIKMLRPDFAKAMASAEAFKAIQKTLSDEQQKIVADVLARELGKQGH